VDAISLSVPVVRLTPEREQQMVEELLRARATLAGGPGMPR
jgi:DNA-binding IclR family transcriptional regulator